MAVRDALQAQSTDLLPDTTIQGVFMNKLAAASALLALLFAGSASAALQAQNSDAVFPNSPHKPDAGQFNPASMPEVRKTKRVVYPEPIHFPEAERVYAERSPLFLIVEPMNDRPAVRKPRRDRN